MFKSSGRSKKLHTNKIISVDEYNRLILMDIQFKDMRKNLIVTRKNNQRIVAENEKLLRDIEICNKDKDQIKNDFKLLSDNNKKDYEKRIEEQEQKYEQIIQEQKQKYEQIIQEQKQKTRPTLPPRTQKMSTIHENGPKPKRDLKPKTRLTRKSSSTDITSVNPLHVKL